MRILKVKHENGDGNTSVLDEYSNKVFRLVVLIVPIFFICGNGAMTVMHFFFGWYPELSNIGMWVSNAVDIGYMVIAIVLVKTSYGANGYLIPRKLIASKWILMCMVVLQWNLNSYICPFSDFWAYAPLFVIVEAFFFDVKFVRRTTFLIILSMVISWFVVGDPLMPAHDGSYYLNMVFRVIGLTFTLFTIYIITWFGRVFIIEAVTFREKEREMREKSYEYEREARMKSDFLANMSHEIRTPMNAVIGMAEIAMREELTPDAKDCLVQIQKSGRSLLNIINDILDYSKIDSGKMEILPDRYEPSSELNDISNILATRIGDKELEFYVVSDTSIPHALLGDAMRIRQILINFINNAIKFTREGSVSLSVTCEPIDDENVSLTFHVKDTGIGIKKEDMDKLFVSFQQVDSRRNRSVEGTGLGLAISQKLAEAMGGTVGVDSVYGKGSDFWFSIPQKVLDSTVDLVIKDLDLKRAVILDYDPGRVRVLMEELEQIGLEKKLITAISEYRPVSGRKDYLFFEHKRYNDSIRDFLKKNPDVTGVLISNFNSDFKPDCDNLFILRRPISTQRIVRVLNDEDTGYYGGEESYTIGYTAPDAKILIVDDNAINITIAKGLLAPMKMQVDSASSGPESIKKIQNNHYDIVLMDHMMPGMDGVDATKIIRETIPGADKLVIIALSANAIEEARNMFLESGMNDFVAKPIEVKELVTKIRKWLPTEMVIKGVKTPETEGDTSPDTDSQDSSSETEGTPAAEQGGSGDPLADLDMLDTKRAVEALGAPDLLRMIAEEYYKSGRETYEGILTAYQNENIKDYTIRVHALKSSSRQIGAFTLGDRAEELELAGKKGDAEFIKAHHDDALKMFSELLDALSVVFPDEETTRDDLPLLTEERLKELTRQLKTACDELDMDAMEKIGEELKAHAWPSEAQDDLTELTEAIDAMEIITCGEIAERMIGDEA